MKIQIGKLFLLMAALVIAAAPSLSQDRSESLTPLQSAIEQQRMRLSSADIEERRDAVIRLGAMRHPAASRAVLSGLQDAEPIVRATSIAAVLSLPPEESAPSLLPLLNDKDVLVRREAAYALGKTKSHTAVPLLIDLLRFDKVDEVRGAAAVALGSIGCNSASWCIDRPGGANQKAESKTGTESFCTSFCRACPWANRDSRWRTRSDCGT